jgi:uncharacterized membrane protein SpoIIM required for sporulation
VETAPTPVPERQDTFLETAVKQFAKRGLLLCVVLFLLEVALFIVVSNLPFFPGEKSFYTNQSNTIGTEFQNASLPVEFWGIFTNNYMIALREFIPVLGPILFGVSLYATARVLEIISLNDHVSPFIVVLVLLLFFPHSWIELPAYAVATAESLFLTYAVGKWLFDTKGGAIKWGAELGQFLIYLAIVTVMLLVAALFESVEIQIGLLFWVTWIPFAGIIVVVILLYHRLNKIREKMKTPAAMV